MIKAYRKMTMPFSTQYLLCLTIFSIGSMNASAQDKALTEKIMNDKLGFLGVGSPLFNGESFLDRIQKRDNRIEEELNAIRAANSASKQRAPLPRTATNGIETSDHLTNVWGSTRPDLIKLESAFTMFALDYKEGLKDHLHKMLRNRGFRTNDFKVLEEFFSEDKKPTLIIEIYVNEKLCRAGFSNLVSPTHQVLEETSDNEISNFLKLKETLTTLETNRWFATFLEGLTAPSRRVLLSVLYDDYAQSIFTSYLIEPSPSLIADFRVVAVAAHAAKQAKEQGQ